jgi:hypothetical protein
LLKLNDVKQKMGEKFVPKVITQIISKK